MQSWVDKHVNTGMPPGFGGIPQEIWIAAPPRVQEREREIMNTILHTGIVPDILNHRQMVFLPKFPQATGVWERRGLPPWRPITVQISLATRLFKAISGYLERVVSNHPMQHVFQRDRNVQDAALATTQLLDRAKQRREELFLLSKDCEKCYDRIPRWVMAYIYRREIDVRTAFGWIGTGKREFGLGQGSVLSIRHIGFYMDLLLEQQDLTNGAVTTNHCQAPGNQYVATESRVEITNIFTGIHATDGVFGASKSFLLHYQPGRHTHEDTVYLNDGLGIPKPVTVVSPAEGFKHLGLSQSTDNIWSKTLRPVWQQLKRDAAHIIKYQLTAAQLQYVVNSVWITRMQYRTQLGTSLKAAHQVDKLVRHVARNVLKLPYGAPREIFQDTTQGIGLTSFVDACNVSRVQLALRVHNSPHIPAYHLLVESLEMYQVLTGLTGHPLEFLLEPPPPIYKDGSIKRYA
ncbi:hypothetical protein PHMEG_00035714 [Phytophthora megakarya]|uniref:Reverse transcriptase domain-containing protein n=1 Tax=Phytophthora megakarya TaxID=4795 RepID=A0A225UNE7_9STRA|nr:hypothetical protein PHMEG_00035714 [Phytophthora megakarya]